MLQTAFEASCMNRASVFEWHKRFNEGRESVRDDERCGRSKQVRTPELIGQSVRVRVTMLRFEGSSGRDYVGWGQHSSNWVSGISTRTMHQSTTPSLSQTIWPRWASTKFLTVPIVETLLPATFGYSLSSEAVGMRELRRWKRLWRRWLTRSHKRTSMGPSRSCWNGARALETYLMILIFVHPFRFLFSVCISKISFNDMTKTLYLRIKISHIILERGPSLCGVRDIHNGDKWRRIQTGMLTHDFLAAVWEAAKKNGTKPLAGVLHDWITGKLRLNKDWLFLTWATAYIISERPDFPFNYINASA